MCSIESYVFLLSIFIYAYLAHKRLGEHTVFCAVLLIRSLAQVLYCTRCKAEKTNWLLIGVEVKKPVIFVFYVRICLDKWRIPRTAKASDPFAMNCTEDPEHHFTSFKFFQDVIRHMKSPSSSIKYGRNESSHFAWFSYKQVTQVWSSRL